MSPAGMSKAHSKVYVHRENDRRINPQSVAFPLLDSDFNIVRKDRRNTADRRKANLKLIWQESQPIRNTTELSLEIANEQFYFDPSLEKFTLGRSLKADVRVDAKFVSKDHAYIAYHEGEFVLQDCSLNGTFIETEELGKIRLQGQKVYLYGEGTISLGIPIDQKCGNLIKFFCQ